MPRDGSGIYTKPYPNVVTNTTISSTVFNGNTADVETDLNAARPILAGGTGANNATQARDNLDAEVAMQVVTNFDAHVWEAGSFYSAIGATNAPVAGRAFAGIAYGKDSATMVIEARDLNDTVEPGLLYVREKDSGTWGAWKQEASSTKVSKTGDTMTGTLNITASTPALTLNRTVGSGSNDIYGYLNGATRWIMRLGAGAESGGQTGSEFHLQRIADSGNLIDSAIAISRVDGKVQLNGDPTAALHAATKQYTDTKLPLTGGTISGALTVTGNIASSGGHLSIAGNISSTGGTLTIAGATALNGGLIAKGTTHQFLDLAGTTPYVGIDNLGVYTATGIRSQAGAGAAPDSNAWTIKWTGVATFYVGSTNCGNFTLTSDYRTKKDVSALPGMWDTVKALRPIKYTQAEYAPLFEADDIERWGFIAHELQDTLIENAATGVKDAPDVVQSPNVWTVVAALTKALQEAMTRIEALEARQ